jgi:hypothetical protein
MRKKQRNTIAAILRVLGIGVLGGRVLGGLDWAGHIGWGF